jgi:hypothetical protein
LRIEHNDDWFKIIPPMNIFKKIENRMVSSTTKVEYKLIPKRLIFSLEDLFQKEMNWRR